MAGGVRLSTGTARCLWRHAATRGPQESALISAATRDPDSSAP